MITMMVWLLISVSDGYYNQGNVIVVGNFKTQEMCKHVLESIPTKKNVAARCIQAEIVK